MSDGYRNGAFALGLVTGGGIALNLFIWLDYRAQRNADQDTRSNGDPSGNEVGNIWDWVVGTFISPSDTLAQWIMAIFTIAAVILVRRTLVATQEMVADTKKMATDTREIGEAQTRAYLRADIGEIFQGAVQRENGANFKFTINLKIVNTGTTPALSYVVFYYLNDTGHGERGALILDQDGASSGQTHSFLAAGATGNVTVSRTWKVDRVDDLITRNGRYVRFSYCIRYVDVFNQTIETPVTSGIIAQNPAGQTAFISDINPNPEDIQEYED